MNRHLTTFIRSVSLALVVMGLVAVAQADTRAYVVNSGLQNVSVVDIATNTILANIPVEGPHNIVVSPDGSHAYVASIQVTNPTFNIRQAFVVAIDTATNSIVANIPLNGAQIQISQGMALTPDSTKLYVTDQSPSGTVIDVIDTATNTITTSIPTPNINSRTLVMAPDGSRLYVANATIGDIYVIDTATNAIVDTILTDAPPAGTSAMVISPDGSRLYASSSFNFTMSVVDTATNTRVSTFPSADWFSMTITPDGTKIYAIGQPDSGPYWVIDTATFTTTTLGDGFRAWWQAAITPDGAFAYLTDELYDTLVEFDTTTNLEVAAIQLPLHPIHSSGGAQGIAIGTIPPAIPFAAFNVGKLQLNRQGFSESGSFTLGAPASAHAAATSTGIDPVTQRVTLTIGNYTLIIPPGSFRKDGPNLRWKFEGTVSGVKLNAGIAQQGKSTTQFDYSVEAKGPDLTAQPQPIRAGFRIGLNVGSVVVP